MKGNVSVVHICWKKVYGRKIEVNSCSIYKKNFLKPKVLSRFLQIRLIVIRAIFMSFSVVQGNLFFYCFLIILSSKDVLTYFAKKLSEIF